MAAKRPTQPTTERAAAEQVARRQREADALRENLRRRKEQARARAGKPTGPENTPNFPPDADKPDQL